MHDEIEIMKTLKHPYIVHLEGIYEDKTTLYIVMEECEGKELFARIAEKERYSEKDASFVIKQILEALKYMHEVNSIVHCDLKPSNIMFLNRHEKSPIKLIDFGMSKILPRLQCLTNACGTRLVFFFTFALFSFSQVFLHFFFLSPYSLLHGSRSGRSKEI